MARNISKAQSFNLYVGQGQATGYIATGAAAGFTGYLTGIQLHRLTSIGGPEWTYERQPINVIGQLAAPYKDTTDSPTVSMPISYYLVDLENEKNLGFTVNPSGYAGTLTGCVRDILNATTDEKNYFVLITPEGQDAIGSSGGSNGVKILGVGNGVIASYTIQGSVGDYPTADVTIEGLNVRSFDAASPVGTPAIDPVNGTILPSTEDNGATGAAHIVNERRTVLPAGTIGSFAKPFIIRPGDITVDLANTTGLLTTPTSLNVQSFNISFDLAREPIQKLGSRYAVKRDITFPVDITFTVEALGGDIKAANLADFVCQTGTTTATVHLKNPTCDNTGKPLASFVLKGLTLQSESLSIEANANQSVSLTWLGQIGSASDAANNLFMSGVSAWGAGGAVS